MKKTKIRKTTSLTFLFFVPTKKKKKKKRERESFSSLACPRLDHLFLFVFFLFRETELEHKERKCLFVVRLVDTKRGAGETIAPLLKKIIVQCKKRQKNVDCKKSL